MKTTSSWIIYSCLIFGSGILCDRKIVRQSELTCLSHGNTKNRFYCSNGRCVDWPLVCDGEEDCSDGTDETNPLCDIYKHKTNRTMDCGRLNITNQAMAAEHNETILDVTPWTVFVIRLNTTNPKDFIIVCMGSLISPNIVISAARCFSQKVMLSKQTPIDDDEYKIAVPPIKSIDDENTKLMEIERIYLHNDYNESVLRFNDISVIVLAKKNMSFSYGIEPVCMDWNNKYPLFYEDQRKVFLAALRYHTRDPGRHSHYDGSFLHTDDCTCQKKNDNICADLVVYNMFCNKYPTGLRINGLILGASISSLHSNSYFFTGIASSWIRIINENKVLDFVSMKYYVPWIRGILNMHHTINSCVLPIVEGVVYTYEDTNEIIPYETLINHNITVIENCALGYHKAYPYRSRVCQEKGKWSSNSDKLCFKMCPPLLSDSLDIECSYNNNYANCSNLSIPNTIAIPSCKLPYTLPNGKQEVPPELLCQSNGTWDKQLYSCILSNSCLLPNVEGVVYSYEGSNTILPYGTLIDYNKSIIENCKVGYYKAYRNRVRVCRRNGKWKTVFDRLCLKMCPPLLSDSLDIECSYDGKYANCSNMSIPDTIASPSCKPTYVLPNGQKETPLELHCQANGTWNNQLYRCDPANSCILPTVEGVIYTYQNSNESLSHGTLINHHQIVIESCELGYHKAYPKSFRVCRGNETWEIISDKLCLKMCPPLLSDSLDIECSYNGNYANCSNFSIPDTKARPSCKPTFALPNGQKETPLELRCQDNGIWYNQLYKCDPDCGKEYIETQVLIENGKIAPVGTAPWNVGIYELSKNNSNYDMICGGSIISPNLVVTAAHCFWKKDVPPNKISINYGRYKVAIGKYYRNFTYIDNEFTKIMNVEIVYLKERYHGVSGFYSNDIAVVVLQNKTSFSNGVLPVCIDWKGNYNISNGDQGKIVGWGNKKKGFLSPILLEASLPYIDHNSCRNMYKNGFESYVNYDKFCAGSVSVSGQGVNGGDSGAGLCFLHSNSYYLTGIVSSKDPDSNYSIAIFTEVKYHISWIHELYFKHN